MIVLLLIGLLAVPESAGAGKAKAVKWTKLSPDSTVSSDPGAARLPDGRLGVLYPASEKTPYSLGFSLLSKKGKLIASTTVAAGWTTMNSSVDLVYTGAGDGGFSAYWSGIRSTAPGEGLNGELVRAGSANAGAGWSVPAAASQDGDKAYVASGIGAGASAGATPILVGAWGDSGPDENGYSFGPTHPTFGLQSGVGASLLHPEVVVDKGGNVYAAWQSIATGGAGIFARRITTTGPLGPPMYAPGSSSKGRQNFRFQLQRTSLVTRTGRSGAWLGYAKGYPSAKKLMLWRVGAKKAKVLVKGKRVKGAQNVGSASGTAARLWVFWSKGKKIFAARTNKKATKVSRVSKLKPPPGAQTIYNLSGEGTGSSRLDLIAHAATGAGEFTYHARVKP